MIKKFIVLTSIILSSSCLWAQNVGINSTGAAPDNSALLDINASPSNDKGLLIPRVALSATNNAAPVTSPATSLMVYNTATAGTAPNNVTPGYYYWNGSIWVRVATDGDSWKIDGNNNTSVSTSFIGTINNTGLAFRTNNSEQMRLQAGGQLTIGSTTAGGKLDVHQTSSNDVARFLNYSNNPEIRIRRAQGTISAPTSTGTANTMLGTIYFEGHNGSSYTSAASIEAVLDATGGTSSDMPGRLAFYTTQDGSGTLSPRMTIKNNGYIGIGTVFPTSYPSSSTTVTLLHVFNSGTGSSNFAQLQLGANKTSSNSKVGELNFHCSISSSDRRTASIESFLTDSLASSNLRGDLRFFTNNSATYTEKMRITGEGNIGIGTTNPLAPLDVRKNINYSGGDGTNQDGPTTAIITANNSSRHNDWPAGWGGGLSTWDICGASTFMTGYATRSDERFKNNINNLSSSLNFIMKLRPVSYFMDIKYESDNKEHLHFGFIAQEVENIFPNIVLSTTDGYKGMNYQELIPVLTKAIQEQQAIIEKQNKEIEMLKDNSKQLEILKAEIEIIKSQLNYKPQIGTVK